MRETYQPPTTSPAGPPHDHAHPCHSRTRPRHSRVGGNPPRCVHTPEKTTPPAVDRNRHNATESDEPQRKLVPARARARGNGVPFLSLCTGCPQAAAGWTLRHSRVGRNPSRCVHTPDKDAPSCRRRKSTQCDRVQRTTTKTRARARGNGVPFLSPGMEIAPSPAAGWTLRHSRTHPRHSRVGENLPLRDSTYRLELPSPNRHPNRPNGTAPALC